MNQTTRLLVEIGPLVVFFFTNWYAGIMVATGVYVAITAIALPVAWKIERRIPLMPVVGGFFVIAFGGLTLLLDDDLFIKVKPTIVNLLFATALFVSYFTRRLIIKMVMETAIKLDDQGWRTLTLRWAIFFVFLAMVNEYVWRNFSTDAWVSFKVFGIMPMTMLFGVAQVPLLMRHQIEDTADDVDEGGAGEAPADGETTPPQPTTAGAHPDSGSAGDRG